MKLKKKPKFLKANIKEIKNKDYKKRLLLSLPVIFFNKMRKSDFTNYGHLDTP